MKKSLFTLLLAFSCLHWSHAEKVALFNGKDLDGWYVVIRDQGKVLNQDIFKASGDTIHVYPTQVDGSNQPFAGLITKESYSHYKLTLEYKWGEAKFEPRYERVRDAGIMYHLFGDEIIWPNSLECQIQEGDTGDVWLVGAQAESRVQSVIRNYSPNGDLVTRGGEGARFARFHRGYYWEKPGWNQIELIVEGDDSRFYVNGKLVNEIIDARYPTESGSWRPLTQGKILLQAEGAEIFYRNIYLESLK